MPSRVLSEKEAAEIRKAEQKAKDDAEKEVRRKACQGHFDSYCKVNSLPYDYNAGDNPISSPVEQLPTAVAERLKIIRGY